MRPLEHKTTVRLLEHKTTVRPSAMRTCAQGQLCAYEDRQQYAHSMPFFILGTHAHRLARGAWSTTRQHRARGRLCGLVITRAVLRTNDLIT